MSTIYATHPVAAAADTVAAALSVTNVGGFESVITSETNATPTTHTALHKANKKVTPTPPVGPVGGSAATNQEQQPIIATEKAPSAEVTHPHPVVTLAPVADQEDLRAEEAPSKAQDDATPRFVLPARCREGAKRNRCSVCNRAIGPDQSCSPRIQWKPATTAAAAAGSTTTEWAAQLRQSAAPCAYRSQSAFDADMEASLRRLATRRRLDTAVELKNLFGPATYAKYVAEGRADKHLFFIKFNVDFLANAARDAARDFAHKRHHRVSWGASEPLTRGELTPGRIVYMDAGAAAWQLTGTYQTLHQHVTVRARTEYDNIAPTPVVGGHYFVIIGVDSEGVVRLTPLFTHDSFGTRLWVKWVNKDHDNYDRVKCPEYSFIDAAQVWTMSGAHVALQVRATGGYTGGYYSNFRGFVDLGDATLVDPRVRNM